jgi:hypothetical protein
MLLRLTAPAKIINITFQFNVTPIVQVGSEGTCKEIVAVYLKALLKQWHGVS